MAPNDAGAATRERILDAAMAIASREGMAAITTRRLAGEAGVNVGLLHYHFGSKEEIVAAVIARWKAEVERILRETAAQQAGARVGGEEALFGLLMAVLDFSIGRPGFIFSLVGLIATELERGLGRREGSTGEGPLLDGPVPAALPLDLFEFVLRNHMMPLLESRLGGDRSLIRRRSLQLFTSLFHPAIFSPFPRAVFGIDLSDREQRLSYVRGVVADALAPAREPV